MMPAAKHGDPQLGVDIHLCVVPPSPSPVPLPTPHMSVVFDPFDYIPIIGATVTVCGMKRATAGTNGIAIHIPPGFPFAPKLPDKDDELFMGSATVVADGDPFSHIAHPVLACQVAGMMSPIRPKKKGGPMLMVLPTVFNLAIPTTVFLGGPPTISMLGMAFKAAFKVLGKFAKSGLFRRIRQKAFSFLPPGFVKCKILRAEPVNILTGAVSVQQEDFTLPGRIPIEWVRSYGSDNPRDGACGYGWETLVDTRLEVDPVDGTVVMHHPTVGPLVFPQLPGALGEDAAELELMDGAQLTDAGPALQVRTKDDRIYHFAKDLERVNAQGATEYGIRRIADLCGNWLDFDWQDGRVVGIDESAGRRIEIVCEDGRITEVALSLPEAEFRHVFVRYEYDEAGDLVSVIDALGNPYTFAYDEHHLVQHTDRRGLSFYYEYDKEGSEGWRVVHSWGDGGLYDYRFEYEDTLNERRITDSLGHVSLLKLDERGLPISEIDPLGGLMLYQYDEAGRTTAIVDAAGARTEYAYDERGNLLKLTRPDGKAVEVDFDSNNKAISITDPSGAVWQQRWDARALLVEQSTPLGSVSRYEYDVLGRLTALTNPRGARTELTLDAFGNLVEYTDALGHRTRFAYDDRGNLTQKVDPLGRSVHYAYDAKDRLTEARLASGATIRCGYDAQDNLTLYVDENGAETRMEYFGLGEIANRADADGFGVQYHYDTEEQLIGVVNQRGDRYQFERDALGRIVKEVDYWGQTRTYTYSLSGYIRQSVDALGSAIVYETDALGRIVKKILLGAPGSDAAFEERFEYDANGNLIACSNPHIDIGRTFDLEGRLLVEIQGRDFTITNEYDEVGNRISRLTTLTLGQVATSHRVRYRYDLQDRPIGIAIDENPPILIEHDAAGQVVSEQLGHGVRRDVEYSVDGHVTRQHVQTTSKTALDISYGYDAAGNLTERRDAEFGIDRYTYDPVGRIMADLDPRGRLTRYFNDPAGDRLTTSITRSPEMTRGEGGEWAREGQHAGAFYRFDRRGTLTERRDERGTLTLAWDASERLVASRLNDSVTRYRYDPLGRRIEKCSGGRRTRFVWDGDALVADARVEIQGSLPDAVREWVYVPDTFDPMVLITGSGTGSVFHYHRHPNGSPTRLTDSHGDVKWAANYRPWGELGTLASNAIDNPLRFQNQYADEETGLFYNRYRYYSPSLKAFTSQDPIGLFAGVNLYSYAPNPWTWIDPLGLNCAHLSNKAVAKRAKWVRARQGVEGPGLRGHFGKHGDQVNAETAKAFDRSARETISEGRRFTYRDRASGEPRVGYFNPASGLFTATSQTRKNPAILTHFPETWENLRKLPGFSHG